MQFLTLHKLEQRFRPFLTNFADLVLTFLVAQFEDQLVLTAAVSADDLPASFALVFSQEDSEVPVAHLAGLGDSSLNIDLESAEERIC